MAKRRLKRKLEKLEKAASEAKVPEHDDLTRFIQYYGRSQHPTGPAAEYWDKEGPAPKGPVDFVAEVIGAEPAGYQKRILKNCMRHDKVAWKAGHGCGKTTTLSWITLWWLLSRPFSRVLIVAPAFQRQIGRYLLPEVRKWVRHAKNERGILLPIKVRAESVEVEGYSRDWFALAIQASDPSKVEGGHGQSLAVLADEAKGLDTRVIEALHGTQTDKTGDRLYFLASTPGGPSGPFYDVFRSGSDIWKLHSTSSVESPLVGDDWIEERKEEWGEHSPVYKARVLGEFPKEEEGQLFHLSLLEESQRRELEEEEENQTVRFGVDVSRFGPDRSVIAVWRGNKLHTLISRPGGETTHIAGWIAREANRWNPEEIVVEDIGIGSGVIDNLRLHNLDAEIVPLNTSEPAEEQDQFNNVRSEMYWEFKRAVEKEEVSLPGDGYLGSGIDSPKGEDLIAELSSLHYEYDHKNRIKVESKEKIQKNIGHSPDMADAAALGHYAVGGGSDFLVAISGGGMI